MPDETLAVFPSLLNSEASNGSADATAALTCGARSEYVIAKRNGPVAKPALLDQLQL